MERSPRSNSVLAFAATAARYCLTTVDRRCVGRCCVGRRRYGGDRCALRWIDGRCRDRAWSRAVGWSYHHRCVNARALRCKMAHAPIITFPLFNLLDALATGRCHQKQSKPKAIASTHDSPEAESTQNKQVAGIWLMEALKPALSLQILRIPGNGSCDFNGYSVPNVWVGAPHVIAIGHDHCHGNASCDDRSQSKGISSSKEELSRRSCRAGEATATKVCSVQWIVRNA